MLRLRQIGRRAKENHLAFKQKHYLVGHFVHQIQVVRHHDRGQPELLLQTQHQVAEVVGHDGVHHRCGFVVEHALGLRRQRKLREVYNWNGMEKRYQVFVSSTYEDLRVERQEVMWALLALDCIPAGMEFFPAADEAQWKLICRVIDDCDFYIVIIGDCLGTLGPGGKSYTQLEYEYAVERGKPVMAFIRAESAKPAPVNDLSREAEGGLNGFRELAKRNKLCAFWSTPKELALEVTQAIIHATRPKPGGGWIKEASLPQEVFARTLRGGTVLEAVIDAGIKDVELWNLRGNSLPPERFFEAAQKEILVSAATAHATLNEWAKLRKSGYVGINVGFFCSTQSEANKS